MTSPLPTYETVLTEAIRSLAIDTGAVTAPSPVGSNILTDTTKAWTINAHRNRIVRIVKGVGIGQQGIVLSNTPGTLTISQAWSRNVGAGAVYVILGENITQVLLDVFFGGGVGGLSIVPLEVAVAQNQAVVAGANILPANATPTNPPCLFRLTAAFSVAGILSVEVTRAANVQVTQFYGGVALNNNSLYMFDHLVHAGDTINYQYSVNALLMTLRVQEIGLGTQ